MSVKRTKEFIVSDIPDLEKVDKWWACLLRKGAKEITNIEWVSNGDLVWVLKVTWSKLDIDADPFNVCMPAYSNYTLEDLHNILESLLTEKISIKKDIFMFKRKIDDWQIEEINHDIPEYEEYLMKSTTEFGIDPTLSYSTTLDTVDKIMASEFLWPCYKSLCRSLLMCEARVEEIKKEISYRSSPLYTIVRVDRGMLRKSFIEQEGYDNKWLFATDDEFFDESFSEEELDD